MRVEIRQALPREDELFLFEVYASSRSEEISLWGWDQGQQLQFLRMQHAAQQGFYRQQYPKLQYQIIMDAGISAGRMATVQIDAELVLVDIILLPEFQGKGLGTAILMALQEQAAKQKILLRLSVLTDSRARQLYERLGFQAVVNGGMYTIMKWNSWEQLMKV